MKKERTMRVGVEGMPAKVEITKSNLDAYIRVQKSGVTNMLNLKKVMKLSGLPKLRVLAIIQNYRELTRGLEEEPIRILEEVDEEMIIKTRTAGGVERREKLTTEQAVAELFTHHKGAETLTRIKEALLKGTKMQGDSGIFYQIKSENHEEVKPVKKVKKTQETITANKPKSSSITPNQLAKDLEITPLELRKVIRGLKLVRKGRFWEWDKEKDKDQLVKIRKAVLGK